MGRRKQSGLDAIASMPWPAGILLGIGAYWFIRHGIGAYLAAQGSPLLKGFSGEIFAPLAWGVLILCWAAAGISALRQRQRKYLLETQTGLDSLRNLSWREFEMLAGESFRRRGYSVERPDWAARMAAST